MRKILCLLATTLVLHTAGLAQDVETKERAVNDEIKTSLVSKFQFSTDQADKIVSIENEFHVSLNAIKEAGEKMPLKEREKRKHDAHITRRANLAAIPMKGRQMEDVMELVESIRRKHNL